MKTRFVTSWDDGNSCDMRLGELLGGLGLRGTFYIARGTCGLTRQELGELAEAHEIGSHTLNHVRWGEAPPNHWRQEVLDGRKWLEDLLGRSVPAFAYPGGAYTSEAAAMAAKVVESARTTLLGVTSLPENRFEIHTTVHARSFGLRHRASGLRSRWAHRRGWWWKDWPEQALALIGTASTVHLWGHSWEIRDQGLWRVLEDTLRRIVSSDVTPLSVSEMAAIGS